MNIIDIFTLSKSSILNIHLPLGVWGGVLVNAGHFVNKFRKVAFIIDKGQLITQTHYNINDTKFK